MAKYEFDHLHLTSPDPVKTAEFYQKMLGARKVATFELNDGRTAIVLNLKGAIIKVLQPRSDPLLPGTSPTDYGLDHIGVRTDDIVTAIAELKAQGANFVQDLTVTRHAGLKDSIAFVLAPEDVLLEVHD